MLSVSLSMTFSSLLEMFTQHEIPVPGIICMLQCANRNSFLYIRINNEDWKLMKQQKSKILCEFSTSASFGWFHRITQLLSRKQNPQNYLLCICFHKNFPHYQTNLDFILKFYVKKNLSEILFSHFLLGIFLMHKHHRVDKYEFIGRVLCH